MALVRADIFSESLMRTITIHAIIPVDKMSLPGMPKRENKPFKTLYLLHGIFGNDTDWVTGTRIQRWAQDMNLAVIMPAGENKFYVDNPQSGEMYSQFIGKELVEKTRALFPLSGKKEDTFIGGLSMGGYGALTNGFKYHDTFSCIVALSSGLILDTVINSDNSSPLPTHRRSYYESVFGPIDKIKGSDKDYEALVEKLQAKNIPFPSIYMACGTEDMLIEENRRFHQFLIDHHVPVTYVEGPGAHTWDFWDTYILKALEWLPLEETTQSIHSGHVSEN